MVAQGLSQIGGIEYFETYAPTTSAGALRLLVLPACKFGYDLSHFDVEQVFTQPDWTVKSISNSSQVV